eukprot:45298-Pleurochrysis_carterae.AAC.1
MDSPALSRAGGGSVCAVAGYNTMGTYILVRKFGGGWGGAAHVGIATAAFAQQGDCVLSVSGPAIYARDRQWSSAASLLNKRQEACRGRRTESSTNRSAMYSVRREHFYAASLLARCQHWPLLAGPGRTDSLEMRTNMAST